MTSVIIVAAGVGKRMGGKVAKQYMLLKDKPILYYTLKAFERTESINQIVVVTGSSDIEYVKNDIIDKYKITKVTHVVEGGSERQYSVRNGLNVVDKQAEIVLIHDGVRPFVESDDIEKLIAETRVHKACVLGVKVKDTIKICNNNNFVVETPDRSTLWQAQTPQAFLYDLILQAHIQAEKEGFLGTDDAVLAEKAGVKIKMVEGSYNNIKITTPEDLQIGERLVDSIK